jgi:Flp pilus assembly protein TadG
MTTPTSRKRQKGAAAVELAVLLVPLMLIGFGVTEFGRALFEYNALVKGTRDAARFLSTKGLLDPADVTTIGDLEQAKCMVVHGNPDCSGAPRVPQLYAAMVTICDSVTCPQTHSAQPTGSGVVNLVTVSVEGYVFTPLVPFVMPSALTFGQIGTTMRQVL